MGIHIGEYLFRLVGNGKSDTGKLDILSYSEKINQATILGKSYGIKYKNIQNFFVLN
jgi:hypothetical protein